MKTLIIIAAILTCGFVSYQAIRHDITITGDGTDDSPMKVDTSLIATVSDVTNSRATSSIVVAKGHPAQSFSNSTISDQDYSSIYTIPANSLIENKAYRITISYQMITGVSTVTIINYVKLGSTKVITTGAISPNNSITRSAVLQFIIHGTAAASGAAAVESYPTSLALGVNDASANNTTQPVNLATSSDLTIIPGITFSGTGSTENYVLRTFIIEQL